jgi:ADP-ribosylglycohydrolase
VPEAFTAFFEGNDFEDVVRKAVSLGGDSDTLTAIAGSIAEVYYGIPKDLKQKAMEMLDEPMKDVMMRFRNFINLK